MDYGCCHGCETDIVNTNFVAWKNGWRPDTAYVETRLAERMDLAARRYYLRRGS
jgi:hypothetical protein